MHPVDCSYMEMLFRRMRKPSSEETTREGGLIASEEYRQGSTVQRV